LDREIGGVGSGYMKKLRIKEPMVAGIWKISESKNC
jgi:hypothetical protein